VRFSKFLGTPFIKCPLCKRTVYLLTPEKPVRYWLALGWQRLQIQFKRQRRAFRRALRGEA
jgi:hypothetical protein